MKLTPAQRIKRRLARENANVRFATPFHQRVRDAIVDRFRAGDTVSLLAWDFGYTRRGVEFCLREALKRKGGRRG